MHESLSHRFQEMLKKGEGSMSALVINFYGSPGGAERRFVRTFRRMRDQGGQERLIINAHGKRALEEVGILFDHENTVVIEDFLLGGRLTAFSKIAFVMQLWWYVLVSGCKHLHYPVDPSYLSLVHSFLGRVLPVGYSLSVVDSTRSTRESFTRYSWFVWRRSVFFASRLDCLSEGIASSVRTLFNRAPSIEVSPCSFTDYSKSKIAARKDFDIVLMNRLCSGKGIELFFDALAVFHKRYGADAIVKVGVFGAGPMHDYVRDRIQALPGLNFEFGYASNPFEILSRAKVFLSLQEKENYPSQSLLEAISCGALVIATDVGETYRIVSDDIGYRVPAHPEALANQLMVALSRVQAQKFNGTQASRLIRDTHTVERFSDYFSAFLRRAESLASSGGLS